MFINVVENAHQPLISHSSSPGWPDSSVLGWSFPSHSGRRQKERQLVIISFTVLSGRNTTELTGGWLSDIRCETRGVEEVLLNPVDYLLTGAMTYDLLGTNSPARHAGSLTRYMENDTETEEWKTILKRKRKRMRDIRRKDESSFLTFLHQMTHSGAIIRNHVLDSALISLIM